MFVGTVVSTTNAGRWATFAVEEVWNGDVGDTVVVKAGPAPTGDPTRFSASSVDRTYEPGTRYLVDANAMPRARSRSRRASSATTPVPPPRRGTTHWRPSGRKPPRPVHRTEPIETIGELADPQAASHRSPWAITAAVAALVLIVGTGVWWSRRRRPTDRRMSGAIAVVLASTMSGFGTDAGSTSGGAVAAGIVAVMVIVAVVLWLLFRRGSIADRARTDVPDPDDPLRNRRLTAPPATTARARPADAPSPGANRRGGRLRR